MQTLPRSRNPVLVVQRTHSMQYSSLKRCACGESTAPRLVWNFTLLFSSPCTLRVRVWEQICNQILLLRFCAPPTLTEMACCASRAVPCSRTPLHQCHRYSGQQAFHSAELSCSWRSVHLLLCFLMYVYAGVHAILLVKCRLAGSKLATILDLHHSYAGTSIY